MPHAIVFAAELYSRQEGRCMVIGTFEKACVPWSPKTTPRDFGHGLPHPDFHSIGPSRDMASRLCPPLATAGTKQANNFPSHFAPRATPIVGPLPGPSHFW